MLVETSAFFRVGLAKAGFDLPTLFHILTWASYSFVYLLPGLLPALLLGYFAPSRQKWIAALGVLGISVCIMFIRTDATIYDLYSFHFNAFVVNLLVTPGGIDSLGGGTDSYITIGMIAFSKLSIQIVCWLVAWWITQRGILVNLKWRWILLPMLLAMVGERMIYGISDIRNDAAILETSKAYPFYNRVTFRSVASKFGIKSERTDNIQLAVDTTRINYPIAKVAFRQVDRPPNIVFLVAESLRWDRLTPEIMPNTWKLAQRSQHFMRHYSSGNGTREGLFGMFYGLYGSYWSSFKNAGMSPLLMDRIQELNYQLDLRTSARFSYPEFNKTLFSRVPLQQLHEDYEEKIPWERDELNASALIKFIETRDPSRPFMSFFFFESTHARYYFPDSSIIARPYLENVNYGDMSRASLAPKIDQLLNRYTNAAHWLDMQMGRVYDTLEKQGLLDNTIIVVTGDHGEEFMENGFWGHNSSFVEQQIHTPMVMWIPGRKAQTIDRVTSHMDIGTTMLQILGAPDDTSSYSLGRNLFDESPRPYIISSDWHSINIITSDLKYRIPYNIRGIEQWAPTRVDDKPYSGTEATAALARNQASILDAIRNSSKFSRKGTQ